MNLDAGVELARRRGGLVADTVVVLALSVIIETLVWRGAGPGDPITGPRPVAALLPLLLAVPLWWRRARPLAACIAVQAGLVAQVLISGHSTEGVQIIVVTGLASYSVAAYDTRRHARLGLLMVVLGYAVWATQDRNIRSGRSSELWAGAFFALYLLAVWLIGTVLQARREAVAAAARAASVQREAQRAVAEERGRIARDLHDIVAHNLSVVVVQAAGGRARVDRGSVETARTLEKIESSGRQALTEMRRLLGVLRADGEQTQPAFSPTPGLADLEPLVAGVRDAGVDIELTVHAERPVSPAIDVSVFRIVQEALTNVLKHAGPDVSATVTVCVAEQHVTIAVVDDGRGPGPRTGLGHGLLGMRERVSLLGGDMSAGGRPEGGFAITARLPAVEPA